MKKMGRPKGENNKEYICSIRMDEHTLKRLEAYCQKMGVIKSQAIRTAIQNLNIPDNGDISQNENIAGDKS